MTTLQAYILVLGFQAELAAMDLAINLAAVKTSDAMVDCGGVSVEVVQELERLCK